MARSHSDPPADSVTDALAPSSLPYYVDRPLSILVNIGFVVAVLPSTLAYNVLKYYTVGPPLASWDLKTLLVTRCLKAYLTALFFFGLPGHDRDAAKIPKGMVPKDAGVQLEILPPVPSYRRIGWAVCPAVPAVKVPSFMVWRKEGKEATRATGTTKAGPNEKIVMYLVGGGYISGHPLRTHLIWSVSRWLNTRVLGVNYRKSLDAESSFPACLLDALSGWIYLTETLGFKPSNIVLMGDSAGGNLCLALAKYLDDLKLTEKPANLGMPGGMILFSPWTDMTSSGESGKTNEAYDYPSPLGTAAVRAHARHFPKSLSTPYFSPSLPSPDGSPRFKHLRDTKIYVQTGTAEQLYSEDLDLAKGLREEGISVRLREVPDDIHVGILFKTKGSMASTEKDLRQFWETLKP